MPELPEVETLRRDLVPLLTDKRLIRVQIRRRDLRFPLPRGFTQAINGTQVAKLGRRGKYLLLHLTNGKTLICHLGMSGQLLAARTNAPPQDRSTPRPKHEHLVFFVEGGIRLGFIDPRRFGFWDICPTADLSDSRHFKTMGLEPLDKAFNGTTLRTALKGKRMAIKPALLDQRVVAGVGNIYASEALFYAGISPLCQAGRLSPKRSERLAQALVKVLRQAIQAGGSTRRDYLRPNADTGWFQHQWAVYEQEGKPCPQCVCSAAGRAADSADSVAGARATPATASATGSARRKTGGVRRIEQAGRSTFYCPRKQG